MVRFLLAALAGTAMAAAADPALQGWVDAGHFKRALPALEKAVRENPNDAQATYLLARARHAYKNLDGALQLAEKAVALEPKNATYHYGLSQIIGDIAQKASVFKQVGYARRYRKEVDTALSLEPNHVDARMALMLYYLEAPGMFGGDRRKAEATAQEIVALNPARGYMAQARILLKDQKDRDTTPQREALYQKAVAADPRNYAARTGLANLCLNLKKFACAEQQAREAQQLDAGRAGGHILLALALAVQDRWTDLEAALAQSEKAVPDSRAPFFYVGQVLVNSGKELPRAEKYLRHYLAQPPEPNEPSHAVAHWRLGLALEKQGRKPEAVATLQAAVRMDPQFEPAQKDLKRLK